MNGEFVWIPLDLRIERINCFFKPVRSKYNLIELVLNTLDYIMSVDILGGKVSGEGLLIYKAAKGTRLYYVSVDKIFSIFFPFRWEVMSNKLLFHYGDVGVDYGFTSSFRIFLNFLKEKENYNLYELYDFCETYLDDGECFENYSLKISLYLSIIHLEDGYIRYDYDAVNANEDLHPLHHFDVFYSSKNTFKVGLRKEVVVESFVNIMDNDKKRFFLEI